MGSKRLLAKELVPIIESMLDLGKCRDYVEPFVGGCNMIDKIKAEGVRRHGYDNNRYLIAMLSCLDVVEKEMPDEMPREEYEAVRADYNAGGETYTDWYIGAVGFLASRSGRFFDGGFSSVLTDKDGKTRNYYLEAKRNVLSQAPLLKDVELGFGDYRETCSKYGGAVIYCDPPYKDTKQYSTSRGFDHAAFWDWCRAMAEKNIVLVSEQTAPDEPWIKTLWQQDVKRAINHSETREATEKLFLVQGDFYDKCVDYAQDNISTGAKLPKDMLFPAAVNVSVKWTNWDMYRDEILERCAQGMCFDCPARRTCERLCRERNIDVTLTRPPCAEAWRVWAAEPCADGKKGV